MAEDLTSGGKALDDALYSGKAASLRSELKEATEIVDAQLIERMMSLGIRPETLAALTLVPLVAIAWADDDMDPRERKSILDAAELTGLAADTPSHRLLHIWTYDRPAPAMLRLWREFVSSLRTHLSAEEHRKLGARILGRAKEVAAAAGTAREASPGISAPEQNLLDELERLFPA
jgi:hypothetical protein